MFLSCVYYDPLLNHLRSVKNLYRWGAIIKGGCLLQLLQTIILITVLYLLTTVLYIFPIQYT